MDCRTDRDERLRSPARGPGLLRLMVAAGLLLAAGAAAQAAEPRWPEGTYKYITVDQPVADALVEFGRNIGTPVRVSKEVKGRLGTGMPVGTAHQFLDWVCSRYGLVWHFDGATIHVFAETEVQTELIRLDANAAEGAAEKLTSLGLSDPRFPVNISEKDDMVSVSGPPSYVQLVRKALGASRPKPKEGPQSIPVRVFRGKTAEQQEFQAKKPENKE